MLPGVWLSGPHLSSGTGAATLLASVPFTPFRCTNSVPLPGCPPVDFCDPTRFFPGPPSLGRVQRLASCIKRVPGRKPLLHEVWSIARRVANRVLHALNGNIAWHVMAAVALAPIVLKVEQGAVEMVGDVSTAVSVAVKDIVDESRMVVTRTISAVGAFISVVLLMVAAVLLWFISRTVLNRLAHYVTGNPSQVSAELESFNNSEAVYKVQGKLGVHKVFVQGGSRGSLRAC